VRVCPARFVIRIADTVFRGGNKRKLEQEDGEVLESSRTRKQINAKVETGTFHSIIQI